ncbi:MAG: MucR family transcriptional regulator [Rhodospirillales bacterium]|nr:MucR family transcriptional regulator [Rhodospirillales bacterium]
MHAVPSNPDLLDLVASIVSAHVAHNSVAPEALPGVIQSVYATLSGLGTEPPAVEKPEPAVPIKWSVFPDYIVCLEDGQKLETLKRHLRAAHAMTPEEYRTRWGLPHDYPMVASQYAARRSALAKEIGLGRKPGLSEGRDAPPIQRIAEGVRGRGAARTATGT